MKEETRIIIIVGIIFAIAIVVGTLIDLHYDFSGTQKLVKSIVSAPEKCAELGGTYVKEGWGQCYDYDEEGYRFYWKLDEKGRAYKIRP